MNDAWKLKFDYEIFVKKRDSVLPFLWVWGPVLDANSFLAMSVMQWKRFEALNYPASMKSVSKFLLKSCKLVMACEQLFRVCMSRVSLSLCMWSKLGQERAQKSMNLWFEYLIFNHEISIFFFNETLPIMEDLVPLDKKQLCQLALVWFAAQKIYKIISLNFLIIKTN